MKLFHIVLTEGQTRNSNILPLRSYRRNFYFLVMMIFHFTLKFFELFKCFRLMFHQVDIPISAQIICEGQKITLFTACLSTHWTAHIKMCYFQQVAILFHFTENEAFQSSCQCGMICISQAIQNQVSPNDPSAWSFFMRIHQ